MELGGDIPLMDQLMASSFEPQSSDASEVMASSSEPQSSDSTEEELTIHWPKGMIYFEIPFVHTSINLEYKPQDGEKIVVGEQEFEELEFDCTFERINDGKSGVIQETYHGTWDSEKESYICKKGIELDEGVWTLTVDVFDEILNETIEEETKFILTNFVKLLNGIDFALSIMTALNTMVIAFHLTQYLRPDNKFDDTSIILALVASSVLPLIISSVVSGVTEESVDSASGEVGQSFLDGIVIGLLINAIGFLVAGRTKTRESDFAGCDDTQQHFRDRQAAKKDFMANTFLSGMLKKILPTWTVCKLGSILVGLSSMSLILQGIQYVFGIDLSLSEEIGDCLGTIPLGFTLYTWYQTLKIASHMAIFGEGWTKTVKRYTLLTVLGAAIVLTSNLVYHKWSYFF